MPPAGSVTGTKNSSNLPFVLLDKIGKHGKTYTHRKEGSLLQDEAAAAIAENKKALAVAAKINALLAE